MAVQMTRAEYQAKYGVAPGISTSVSAAPASKIDTTPSIAKMTRAEYEAKFGVPVGAKKGLPTNDALGLGKHLNEVSANGEAGKVPAFAFGNPVEEINKAKSAVSNALSATGERAQQGQGAAQRGVAAASAAAGGALNTLASIIPGGKAALGVVGDTFTKATDFAGNIGFTLADISQKLGLMTPEQRQQYDIRAGEYAKSTTGQVTTDVADTLNNLGNIATTILGAKDVVEAVKETVPKVKAAVEASQTPPVVGPTEQFKMDASKAKLVSQTADEIAAVEQKYVKGRKANLYSKDSGAPSRERIAQSNVLNGSVNSDGLIQTNIPGGAVDQYRQMTIAPAEGVVRSLLEREGGKTHLSVVERGLRDAVMKSGLQGADLKAALDGVRRQIAGLRIRADVLGDIPNTLLHDAKINETSNINYQTPPETATYRKAIARGYKKLVEENSNVNVREINAELAKYYEDIARLMALDGKRVSGGRLGKYIAQISGNIVGGAVGNMVGGPIGMALGTVAGGEAMALMKGRSMASAFTKPQEAIVAENPILRKAVETADSPRLQLPAGGTLRSQMPSGPTINLPAKSASTIEAQSKSLGSRNKIYSEPSTKSTKTMPPKSTTPGK